MAFVQVAAGAFQMRASRICAPLSSDDGKDADDDWDPSTRGKRGEHAVHKLHNMIIDFISSLRRTRLTCYDFAWL